MKALAPPLPLLWLSTQHVHHHTQWAQGFPRGTTCRDEVFGPVAPLVKFRTDEEAVALANDTIYGLAAYRFTESVSCAWAVAVALEYGMVGVNETAISTELAPFGGIKQSGLGREGSKYGIEEYVEAKYICLGNIPPM